MDKELNIPIWEKPFLTLEECANYMNVGIHRMRELSNEPDCDFIVFVGSKKLFKRKKLEQYIEQSYSI